MNDTDERALRILDQLRLLKLEDHFVYNDDRHGSAYFAKEIAFTLTESISRICYLIAERFAKGERIQAVVGPALGGIIMSQWTAHHLSSFVRSGEGVLALFAEQDGDGFVFKRDYGRLVHSKIVLVVEDVLSTGSNASKVVKLVRANGGHVVGVGAICNRGGVTSTAIANVLRLESLVNIALESWNESECPLCRRDVPVNTEFGKGAEFMEKKKKRVPV